MSRIRLLKFMDRWLGTILVKVLPGPSPPPLQRPEPSSILLIRPGGIGDAVLLVPAIQTLRERFPQASIDILAERRNAGAFALCPGIRKVFVYDRPWQLLAVLRQHYDVVIDTEQWHRLSAAIARLVSALARIGYATNQRQRMFTHAIPYCHDDYEIVSFFHLLEPLGINGVDTPEGAWLHVPDFARQAVDPLLAGGNKDPLVVIFPGASITEKQWGGDRFRVVAEWCLDHQLGVVIIGGEGDYARGEIVTSGLNAINLAGMTSLTETASIIERAAVVVSGDSGLLHIAAGLGRPTVALFGPSSSKKWAPRDAQHIVLLKANCSPCSQYGYTPKCPRGVICMRDIAVSDVTNAISCLIKSPGPKDNP